MERLVPLGETPIPDVPFTHLARFVINNAREFGGLPLEGKIDDDAHVGTEHLLLSLALHPNIVKIIVSSGIPVGELVSDLADYVKDDPNTPETDDQGFTFTVVQALNNARILANKDNSQVTTTHMYAGLIEAGRGKALMTLGRFLGYPEDDPAATPFIQDALFEHIPSMRRE
ncbi:MAG: Clp protease N-terminal domain-containing protein [bacterium]|nr:Clp protease N-terminal domain-containing protein [bacterium]